MPSTHTSLLYHAVFATRERQPWLPRSRPALLEIHNYIGGTVRGLGGLPFQVGGVEDHVHILMSLNPTHRLADFMGELKKGTTHWIQRTIHQPLFRWQEGYSAFTVSASNRQIVSSYIARQAEHHRRTGSRDELIRLLARSAIQFEPPDIP